MNNWILTLLGLLSLLGLMLGGTGCAMNDVLQTGPKAAANATDITKAVTLKAIDKLEGESGIASAEGKLNDPRYRMKIFVGGGTYIDIVVSLEGVDIGGDLSANLTQQVESDTDLRDAVVEVLTSTQLSEQQRKDRLFELAKETLSAAIGQSGVAAADPPADPAVVAPPPEATQ